MIDRNKIELILKLQPPTTDDEYSHQVASILKRPSWLHPILRHRFKKQFVNRVQLILAEHTRGILEAVAGSQSK